MKSLSFSGKAKGKAHSLDPQIKTTETDMDIDMGEVYFLIMHFLSMGPCHKTYGQFWNELLENQLLPRRYHAWYSRSGIKSGDENDDGISFPLSYNKLAERYPHVEKDHLVKLLKQLLLSAAVPSREAVGGNTINAATVPTLLGTDSFSLLSSDQNKRNDDVTHPPGHLRWPHMKADQVRGLSLREIGGGFARHHRAPSNRAACYAIAKPSTMVQKMENIKKVRGHRNAVYCAIFDRSGRYVITGSDDRLVKIWSMETAYCLASCRGHEGDITDLAVNFNNTLVASASNDYIIRVWRLPDGLPISVLRGHSAAVTAIAFSPRPGSVYQLLSSSDDGTCRIWDARHSQFSPRVYVPKPPESVAGPSTLVQSHSIFCCAFNASGTFFVTGSSDFLARVWNACKSNTDDLEKPNYEIDVLAGHENDVNYVQFSGSAVTSRYSLSDSSKEENIPKFKNSWFTHDNIVTCSRDGSAIIWIPRPRRSHGKSGRWQKAYHLKVPPPPMPPQPPRGGPRQRILPTPRGVNMIAWSLDNRFVLAAIMDCRICVWNAVDGSLVHSLTGHTASTYVLDVHPFNPRIAMSAGYDGKTIVWDIWEGAPIRTYEIGRFKLVDGKFSPDGTSIILSDDVGQLYILNTGEGESQKDAKYDQFFLGDYRPLIQDTNGNVLDQETQLAPYRRNMQDLLCDSVMIPYPEPYQSMYQKRRLGALGIEWRPSSIRFAVGPDVTLDQDYPMLPIADLEMLIEPLPGIIDAMDWEPAIENLSEDTDSEYHVTEDTSGGEQGSFSSNPPGDPASSEGDSDDDTQRDSRRRSKRKKQKGEVEIMSSFGRRVKRKNLDEYEGSSLRNNHGRKSRNGRKTSKKSSKSSRPRRAAARNALHLFSRITGASADGEDEDCSEGDSSESKSTVQDSYTESEESDVSLHDEHHGHSKGKEVCLDQSEDMGMLFQDPKSHLNYGNRKRLVLKLPNRDSNRAAPPQSAKLEYESESAQAGPSSTAFHEADGAPEYKCQDNLPGLTDNDGTERSETRQLRSQHFYLLDGCKGGNMRWGGVRSRTSKHSRTGDLPQSGSHAGVNLNVSGHVQTENVIDEHSTMENECERIHPSSGFQNHEDNGMIHSIEPSPHTGMLGNSESAETAEKYVDECKNSEELPTCSHKMTDNPDVPSVPCANGTGDHPPLKDRVTGIPTRLRIRSKNSADLDSRSKTDEKSELEISRLNPCCGADDASQETPKILSSNLPCNDNFERPSVANGLDEKQVEQESAGGATGSSVQDSKQLQSEDRMFSAVYRRSRFGRGRSNVECLGGGSMETSTSNSQSLTPAEGNGNIGEAVRRTRSIRLRPTSGDINLSGINLRFRKPRDDTVPPSTSLERASGNRGGDESPNDESRSNSKVAVGVRSTRIRRSSFYIREPSPPDRRKSNQSAKSSWLMLVAREEHRYIPQQGDEVVYLRQGHEEYISECDLRGRRPWETIRGNISAVEFCRVEALEYTSRPGSGESCSKMTLKFIDPSSAVSGKTFQLTLPEVTGFPDFLVERTKYDVAMERNWTTRDKCRVWWKNEGEEDGDWWEGRIIGVQAKSAEYPDSPWERYIVRYKKGDPSEQHRHSPWELFDSDTQWKQPQIDENIRARLLHAMDKLEQSGNKSQDNYGVQKMRQVSQRSQFINRFPVPLSLEIIHARLKNNYYRRLDAVKHDIDVMLLNAESYFGRSAELSKKIKQLSSFLTKTLSSL
nr:PH-interacting protein [Ipomoea batatas]